MTGKILTYNTVFLMRDFNVLTADMNLEEKQKALDAANHFNPDDMFFVLNEELDFNDISWFNMRKNELNATDFKIDPELIVPEQFLSFPDDDELIWSRALIWDDDDAYDAREQARNKWLLMGKPRPNGLRTIERNERNE